MFDNGNNRVLDQNGTICGSPGATPCYSRPLILSVDESSKTAQVVWTQNLSIYSSFLGSIEQFANGNVEFDMGAFAVSPNPSAARVVEETEDANPQVIWQFDISDQWAYRAFRIPSLYPGVQW